MSTPSHTVAIAKADSHATQEAFARWGEAKKHLRHTADLCAPCFTAVSARMEKAVDPDMLVTRFVNVSQLAGLVRLALDHHETHHRFAALADPGVELSASEVLSAAHIAIDELTRSGDAAAAAARYRSYSGALEPADILTLEVVFAAHLRSTTNHQERARVLEEADSRFHAIDFARMARFDLPLVSSIASALDVPESLLLELRGVRPSEAIAAIIALGLTPA